ncbi:MAG: DUF2066 domain-containing protein [Ketobacter sp.]|nr:MAG: DUF2066 domain-containing protein [Ketobacter sp.]
MSKVVKHSITLIALSFLMMLGAVSYGAEITNLYKASVEVENRSAEARDVAVAEGLARVLVRVSGNSAIVAEGTVQDALKGANRYMAQYGYQTRETLSPEDGKLIKTTLLNVSFDEVAVNQFLRKQGFPIWSSSRPNIVLWSAVRDGGGSREVVGGQNQPALQQLFSTQASRRGLPLILPAFDSEDLSQVRAGDIWGMFVDPIKQASQRYQANVVVVAKLLVMPDGAQISAAMSLDDRQQWWEVSGATLEQAVADFMDQLGDRVGARFAVQASLDVGEQVILDVSNVDELRDYARLGEYLDGLLAIRDWRLSLVKGSQHQYLITLESNLEALEQSFRIDRKLLPQPPQLVVPLGGETAAADQAEPAAAESGDDNGPEALSLIPETDHQSRQEPAVLYYRWNG